MGQRGHRGEQGVIFFPMEKETRIIIWEQVSFVHHRIVSAVKRVEFFSDRFSYIVMRVGWCSIIVLNVHAPSEEKCGDSKDSFYEELDQVFHHFPKYLIKIMLGDINEKWGEMIIFKQTIGNESLHQDSNDNGVRIVNFAT